jgi:nucleotide-binding universal stress UspA family protein
MKNILIPTDFSENSLNAITYAQEFFKYTTCNFYIMHVTKIFNYAGGETPIIPSAETIELTLLKDVKIKLKNLVERVKSLHIDSKHNFIPISSYDYFIDAVRNEVVEKKINLIVMGTKGASGLKEVIVGSNTGDVITRVKTPLLAVPEKAKFTPPKEIAFPTDYNVFYQTKILNDISEFMQMYNSRIRILHVARKDEELSKFQKENKEYLNDFFADYDHGFYKVTNKKVEAGVQCFVESRNINMIVMVAKNLNLFQQILFKPTVEEVSYHTHVPFLVLHE